MVFAVVVVVVAVVVAVVAVVVVGVGVAVIVVAGQLWNEIFYLLQERGEGKYILKSIGSFPLKIETTSEVYVGDIGLHISRLHKCHNNRTPWNTK